MNYAALIQNRKSVRSFTGRKADFSHIQNLERYYNTRVRRLLPEITTELYFFSTSSRAALEGAAGYNRFLVGAPEYMVLLTEPHPQAGLNAGFVMEDMLLKATDLGLDTCWVTFTDSEEVKGALGIESELDVAAVVAFGHGEKTTRRLRLNIRSMSNVDIIAKRGYMEPKRSVREMAFAGTWGSHRNLEDYTGFFDDMLWEALYAASLAPSYLNRQAYGFVLRSGEVVLVSRPDEYTTELDGALSLGIVLHHFTVVAENWAGKLSWSFDPDGAELELPQGHRAVARCAV